MITFDKISCCKVFACCVISNETQSSVCRKRNVAIITTTGIRAVRTTPVYLCPIGNIIIRHSVCGTAFADQFNIIHSIREIQYAIFIIAERRLSRTNKLPLGIRFSIYQCFNFGSGKGNDACIPNQRTNFFWYKTNHIYTSKRHISHLVHSRWPPKFRGGRTQNPFYDQ